MINHFVFYMILLSPDLEQLLFIFAEMLYITLTNGVLLGWCVYVCCITIYSNIVYKQIQFEKLFFLSVCFSFSFCLIFLTSCVTICFKWWGILKLEWFELIEASAVRDFLFHKYRSIIKLMNKTRRTNPLRFFAITLSWLWIH